MSAVFNSFIKYIYRVFLELIKSHLWILDSTEKSVKKPLKIIYIGTEKNKNYIKRMVYNDICDDVYLGEKFFWHIYFILRKNRSKCSLAIIEGTFIDRHLYRSMKDFFVPLWVESVTNLPLIATNKASKEDFRQLKKSKFKYVVTKDTEKLNDFYYNMHRPMIRARYTTGAFEISYDNMMKTMKEGCYELLLIKKHDVSVSGVVLNRCEEIPRLWKNGIRDMKYRKDGAITATYIYASEYLLEKGYKKLSFGLMRTFLNDGLLQYKKKWNVRLKIAGEKGYILKPLVASDALNEFFENTPFIYREKNKLYGAVFINKEVCTKTEYKVFQNKYYMEGMSELNIFSVKENRTIQKVASVTSN